MHMKKLTAIWILLPFISSGLLAQTPAHLTNTLILKMTKAKLSEELIISEINDKKNTFTISTDSLNYLTNQNVSPRVIEAMIAACTKQTNIELPSSKPAIEATENKPEIKTDSLKKSVAIPVKATLTNAIEKVSTKKEAPVENKKLIENFITPVQALNFSIPLGLLSNYFDSEYNSLILFILKWDKKVKDSLDLANIFLGNIKNLENEISIKKNADAKIYSNEIEIQKKKLTEFRIRYRQLKTNIHYDQKNLTVKIKEITSEAEQSIENKFNEVSQLIKKYDTDPGLGEVSKEIVITRQKFNISLSSQLVPLVDILSFYQNEIAIQHELILSWSEKIKLILQQDQQLSKKLDPLKKQLDAYKLNKKNYKNEIATVRKQIELIENDREQLAKKTKSDSYTLSENIQSIAKEAQSAIKSRFTDVYENINYAYEY